MHSVNCALTFLNKRVEFALSKFWKIRITFFFLSVLLTYSFFVINMDPRKFGDNVFINRSTKISHWGVFIGGSHGEYSTGNRCERCSDHDD